VEIQARLAKNDLLSFRPRGVMGRNSTGEKSFLDPSHSLGMTGFGLSPWRPLRTLREQYPNPRVFGSREICAKGVNHEQTGTR